METTATTRYHLMVAKPVGYNGLYGTPERIRADCSVREMVEGFHGECAADLERLRERLANGWVWWIESEGSNATVIANVERHLLRTFGL